MRVDFHVGERAERWVWNGKKPTEKTTPWRRSSQRQREKNFCAHTLELRAPHLTYCEMRRFFWFSFYFLLLEAPERRFPSDFNPVPSKAATRERKFYSRHVFIITTACTIASELRPRRSRPISVFPTFIRRHKKLFRC